MILFKNRHIVKRMVMIILLMTLFMQIAIPGFAVNTIGSDPFDQKTFYLGVQNSKLKMDVSGGSGSDGAPIVQWSAGAGQNQQWTFIATTSGYYKIISKGSSKALVVDNASTADGAGIIQYTYSNDTAYNDEWSVIDVGNGYYQLKNRLSNKVIEMPDNSLTSGTQFVQRTAGTGSNQQFEITFDKTVNDNSTGTGQDQFAYSSGWGYSSSESKAYSGDNHYSNTTDATAAITFIGTKVRLYGAKNSNQGIAAISIDNGPETMVDTYSQSRMDQFMLFESANLSTTQEHTLKIRVTGQKNSSASNAYLSIDRVDILSRVTSDLTPEDDYTQSTEMINGVNHSVITVNYTGTDAGDSVKAAIQAAKAAPKPVILDFPTGTYHFRASTANTVQYYMSNSSSAQETPDGWRKVGLLFKDIEDLTIRGNGSTLLFHGVMTPIVFDHATNVKMNGINFDFNRPVVSELTVTEVGSNYMKASAHPDSWYYVENNQMVWMGEENWLENGTQYSEQFQEYDPATKETWRIGNPLNGVTSAQDLGNREVQFNFWGTPNYTVGHTFQFRNSARRETGAFIYRSKDIIWTDVNFYAAPGLNVLSQFSENVTMDSVHLGTKAGSGRTNAAMVDFFHVSGAKGNIIVKDSSFLGAHDDAINVHGTYLHVVDIPASNQVKVQFMHYQSWGFDAFTVGDTIEYINRSTLLSKGSAVVTGVTRLNDTQILLTLDQAVPSLVSANNYVLENVTWTPNVTIQNNTFETIPVRAILLTTRGNTLIENNTFNHMQMSAILIAEEANYWNESGMVKNVLIRNNVFNHNSNYSAISIEPESTLPNPDKTVHSHIVIDGNQFNNSNGDNKIYARSVNGFSFINNTAMQGGFDISLDESRGITVTGNSFNNQSNVTKKINMYDMYTNEGTIDTNQGFNVTQTNSITPIAWDPNDIPQEFMTAVTTSSHSGNEASKAIDGDRYSNWHTEWSPMTNLPQSLTIDLGSSNSISKVRYLPRQDGDSNGNITSYQIETSTDGSLFTTAGSGTWADVNSEKSAVFSPITARYVKLTATAGHGGYASAAEINVVRSVMVVDNQALAALITSAQNKHDSAVEGNENGQYPSGSKQTLQAAIDQAKQARDNVSVTQQQLQQAGNDLAAALQAFEVSVNVKVQSITVTSASATIDVKGGTLQFVAAVLPANATNKSVTWAVYEADGLTLTDKAAIDTNGLLTALKNGTVSVLATAIDGSGTKGSATITISGQLSVTSISVNGEGGAHAITIKDGTLQMHAVVLPAGANNVTWSIWENDGVTATNKGTIDANGVLTAKKDGIVKVVATATDGSGIQGSNYMIISGQTPLPTSVPQATLTGPASIQAGASFSTNFGLSNVSDSVSSSVYAVDMTLNYDANAVDFVSVEPLKSGFTVVQKTTDVPGQIRMIAVSEGEAGAITTSGDVFKFNWKAKPNTQSLTVNFELTNVDVSNALSQKTDSLLTNLMVSVTGVDVPVVDKTTLQTVMNLAQSIYDRAVEGTQVGQYPAGTKAVLLSAISAADLINKNPAATQQQIDVTANALNQAIQHFNEQINRIYESGDANEDGSVDIGDLGLLAASYGKTSASSDWNQIKGTDFNHDGKIDIIDVVGIAHLILQ